MAQIHLLESIRIFFKEKGFHDVLTPPVVENPGMEVHIHPFQLKSSKDNKEHNLYLHTSPEFWMKDLLSHGLEKIFTLNYCFRDESKSEIHRPQFIMLEWYRANEFYTKIMDDCLELVSFSHQYLKSKEIDVVDWSEELRPIKKSIQEVFQEILEIDILEFLEVQSIRTLIKTKFKEVPLPNEELEWDDYFFLLFLNLIEPELKKYPFLILHSYPSHLAALSTINSEDQRVCDRFELYSYGIELANCFNELTEVDEQKERFDLQVKQKKDFYRYSLPAPSRLVKSLERGLPPSTGIALGVERLLLILTKNNFGFWT